MNFYERPRPNKTLAVCLSFALCVGNLGMGIYAADAPRILAPNPANQSTASSAPQKQDTTVNPDASTPDGTLELAMQAIKALEIDALCRYSNNQKTTKSQTLYGSNSQTGNSSPVLFGGKNPKQDALFQECVRSLTWKLGAPSVSGNTAKISLTITNRDFGNVMTQIVSQALLAAAEDRSLTAYGETNNDLLPLLKAVPANKTVSLTVTVQMRKTNGVWKLQIDDKFANGVCGNLMDGMESKENKAKIDAASKKLEEYLMSEINLDALNKEMMDAMKEFESAMGTANMESQLRDAMKEIDFEKEIQAALKDAMR